MSDPTYKGFKSLGLWVILCGSLWAATSLSAQRSFNREADLYDAIEVLVKSAKLDTLQQPETIFVTLQTVDDLIAWVSKNPAFSITQSSSNNLVLQVSQPKYLNLFSANQKYTCMIQDSLLKAVSMDLVFTQAKDGLMLDDSTFISASGEPPESSAWQQYLYQDLWFYRSLGLPEVFRPTVRTVNPVIDLQIHGRNLTHITYSDFNVWKNFLLNLTHEKSVYAGPSRLEFGDRETTIYFYLFITTPQSGRHHFFLITHRYTYDVNSNMFVSTKADLYPYVRIDNVKSLFLKDHDHGSGNSRTPVKRSTPGDESK